MAETVLSDNVDAAASPRWRRVRFGLASRVVALIVCFVMLAEVAIFIPLIANFRNNRLRDRLSAAYTAALVFEAAPANMVPEDLARVILASVGAKTIVLKTNDTRRLLASTDLPPKIDESYDLRDQGYWGPVAAAFRALWAPDGRILNVIGDGPMGARFIEITLDETQLRHLMIAYAYNSLRISLLISGIVGALAFLALHLMVLAPVRRLTSSITAFGADPQNAMLIVEPSGRGDEIGVAEDALAMMQGSLVRELGQAKRLAALGLAVAKINHDLRNMLASAQLLSDRLSELSDPLGRRLAPRLVATLDRAIAFCQSTLTYGRAAERAPKFTTVSLRALVTEAAETVVPPGADGVAILNETPVDIQLWCDSDQMFRVMLNLFRNAVDALESAGPQPGRGPTIRVRARREATVTTIEICDNGPGVPARARARLFEAFQNSARPGGTGLGLAIAADLVRAHGGEITLVEGSTPDSLGGAVFRVVLPRRGRRNRPTNGRNGQRAQDALGSGKDAVGSGKDAVESGQDATGSGRRAVGSG